MARILYWNIQQFGINKINNPNRQRQRGSAVSAQMAAAARRTLIMNALAANLPDIFVVVETSTGGGAEGTLVTAGGALGALDLLTRIRAAHGPAWMLVPPLILGQGNVSEGISVFFNSANLVFTGPFGWQGGGNPAGDIAAIGGVGNLVNYPAPWYLGPGNAANVLPAGNTPGTAGIINPFLPQNRLAGQWLFTDAAVPAARLQFPGVGNRPPFLTTFWDAANNRNIKLLSFHASPHTAPAVNGTHALSTVRELTTDLGAQDAGVIVGDFNVNLFSALLTGVAYGALTAGGYTQQILPTANTAYPDKAYVCTHIKPGNNAKPWNTNGYPGYDYMGSAPAFPGYDSIDNVFTRYGAAAGGPASNVTVVNLVSGTPYNAVLPVPAGVPPGHYAYRSGMQLDALNQPVALPVAGYAPGTVGALKRFKGWANYGVVRSTSDHMALVLDV